MICFSFLVLAVVIKLRAKFKSHHNLKVHPQHYQAKEFILRGLIKHKLFII